MKRLPRCPKRFRSSSALINNSNANGYLNYCQFHASFRGNITDLAVTCSRKLEDSFTSFLFFFAITDLMLWPTQCLIFVRCWHQIKPRMHGNGAPAMVSIESLTICGSLNFAENNMRYIKVYRERLKPSIPIHFSCNLSGNILLFCDKHFYTKFRNMQRNCFLAEHVLGENKYSLCTASGNSARYPLRFLVAEGLRCWSRCRWYDSRPQN